MRWRHVEEIVQHCVKPEQYKIGKKTSVNPCDTVKMSADNLKVDDLVWVKDSEALDWPAKIAVPNEMKNENISIHYVYFFGTHKNAWVSNKNIVLHTDESIEKFKTSKKSTALHDAFEEMKQEIEKRITPNIFQKEEISLEKSPAIKLTSPPVEDYTFLKPAIPPAKNQTFLKPAIPPVEDCTFLKPAINPLDDYNFLKPAIPPLRSVKKNVTSTKPTSVPRKRTPSNMTYAMKLDKLARTPPQKRKHSNAFTGSEVAQSTSKDCQIPSTSKDYQMPSTSKDYQMPSTSKNYQMPSTSKDYQMPSTSKDYQMPSTSKDYQMPSTSKDYHMPSTSKDYQMPSTSMDWQMQPSTSKANQVPLTSEDFEMLPSACTHPSSSADPDSCYCARMVPYTSKTFLLDKLHHPFKKSFDCVPTSSLDDCDITPSLDDLSVSNLDKVKPLSVGLSLEGRRATSKEIGFLGLGKIGSMIAKNLLNSGHILTVWNRSQEKCRDFVLDGAEKAQFPADVVKKCDIIFCCMSDEKALNEVFFGKKGILEGFEEWDKQGFKGYVEMTSVDPGISQELSEQISKNCGTYLEAPVVLSRKPNKQEFLLIICAGNDYLFHDCITCFYSATSSAFYLGRIIGTASKMKVVLSMIMGTANAALWETMSLVYQSNIPLSIFMEFLSHGPLGCKTLLQNAFDLIENDVATSGLKSIQRDLNIASLLAEECSQPLPLAAAANQHFIFVKQVDYSSVAAKYKESMNIQEIVKEA